MARKLKSDRVLFITTILLVALSVVMVYSASALVAFERYAQPLALVDSFLALFALGVLLALVRLRTGAIAACIGLHAAGVCTIFVLRDTTSINGTAQLAGIVGTYDGVIGWAAFVWIAAIGVAFAILQNQSSESSSRDS